MSLMLGKRLTCSIFTTYCKIQSKTIIQNVNLRLRNETPNWNIILRHSTSQPHQKIDSQNRFKKSEEKWKSFDGVPKEYELIYKTNMNLYIGGASFITTTLAAVAGLSLVFTKFDLINLQQPLLEDSTMYIASSDKEFIIFTIFSICVAISLRYIANNFALRIYNKNKDYIALFQGHFPGFRVKEKFQIGDIELSTRNRIIPWEETNYRVNNRNCLLLGDYFKTPYEFRKMLDEVDTELIDEEEEMKKRSQQRKH